MESRTLMRYGIFGVGLALFLGVAAEAGAQGINSCGGPFCNGSPYRVPWAGYNAGGQGCAGSGAHPCFGLLCGRNGGHTVFTGLFGARGGGPPLPVYQAAPWYLYFPYDAYFQTPAPMNGLFYPPPAAGNWPSNPYYPTQPSPYVPYSPLNRYPFSPAATAPAYNPAVPTVPVPPAAAPVTTPAVPVP